MPEIFVSPHPDDIGYSAFAAAFPSRQGSRTMVTVFSRSWWNFAGIPCSEIDRITALRAAEEQAFAQSCSLKLRMLELPDGRVRGYDNKTEYTTEPGADPIFKPVLDALEKVLLSTFEDDSIVYVPLGIALHVDHLICREAVLKLVPLNRVIMYEDLPYVARHSDEEITAYAKTIDPRLEPTLVTFSDSYAAKRSAIANYATQLETHTIDIILGYAERIGGSAGPCERYWQTNPVATTKATRL